MSSTTMFSTSNGIRATTLAIEMVGSTLSMVALIVSLFIFCHFRNLWSTQTRLRKNLFISLGIQIIVRLVIAIHSLLRLSTSSSTFTSSSSSSAGTAAAATARLNKLIGPSNNLNHADESNSSGSGTSSSINKVAFVDNNEMLLLHGISHKDVHGCETFFPVFLLEYSRTAMFLWMFLEGLYLHSMITVFPVIQERLSLKFYYSIGWASPILLTFIWVMFAAEKVNGRICWRNYMFTTYFWVLEGPKLTILFVTFFFQINVIRILFTKLWRSSSPEVNQLRKAVSRSIILVPLLGITNYLHLQMRHSPLDSQFPSWSYSTALVTSFQGVFAALIYCFLNGEVQSSVRRWYTERRNEQREIIMVNGGPAGNCSIPTGHTQGYDGARRYGNKSKSRRANVGAAVEQGSLLAGAIALPLSDEGSAETLLRTGIPGHSSNPVNVPPPFADPFKENWNDVDLSAHCNVDIEHIEIPLDYIKSYGNKKKKHGLEDVSPDPCPGSSGASRATAATLRKGTDDNDSRLHTHLDSTRSSAYLVEIDNDLDVSSVDLKTEDEEEPMLN